MTATLTFTLTPDELDRILRFGLDHIGLGPLATAISTLSFENLRVYSLTTSETIDFTYTKQGPT